MIRNRDNNMVFRVVENLQSRTGAVTFNTLEEAYDTLVMDGKSMVETLAIFDANATDFWTTNRTNIISTIENIQYIWDQDAQILERIILSESEEVFYGFRSFAYGVLPALRDGRTINTLEAVTV